MNTQQLHQLIQPFEHLPLECDGMTRVISSLLEEEGIPHKCVRGKAFYRKCDGRSIFGQQSILHYWIQLQDEKHTIIDYRARMWFGDNADIPHGVIDSKDFPCFEYRPKTMIEFHTPEFLFQVLTGKL